MKNREGKTVLQVEATLSVIEIRLETVYMFFLSLCLFIVDVHMDIYFLITGQTRKRNLVLYQGRSREALVNFSITQLEGLPPTCFIVILIIACGKFS